MHQGCFNVPGLDLNASGPDRVGLTPAGSSSINLALAAERQLPGPPEEQGVGGWQSEGDSVRVSLMRLLEEEGGDTTAEEEKGVGMVGNDSVCCMCMGRNKGATSIPCGHTFCSVVSVYLHKPLWWIANLVVVVPDVIQK
ncbi:Zinc finger, RING/FYVE/PHD-type [Sesbania bispinosa]|nr:Zinc finger, RING/FYVE/PHD-type [Sesbania bispinosa]